MSPDGLSLVADPLPDGLGLVQDDRQAKGQAAGKTGSGLVCVAGRRASAWSIPGPRAKGRLASQNQAERAAPERPDT